MSRASERPAAFGAGEAVVMRIDQGHGPHLNWEQVKEVTQHPTAKLSRAELVEVIAYLGAQLHGARSTINREATLAMMQVERVVKEYKDAANRIGSIA